MLGTLSFPLRFFKSQVHISKQVGMQPLEGGFLCVFSWNNRQHHHVLKWNRSTRELLGKIKALQGKLQQNRGCQVERLLL